MNVKQMQLFAALAVALAGNVAMATEGTQFNDTPSTLTRAEVKADLARAKADGTLLTLGEATVFIDRPVASTVTRAEMRGEARAYAHSHPFNPLYVGS